MKRTLIIALAALAASQVFATEFVTNGDFEATVLGIGWTQSSAGGFQIIGDWSGTTVTSAGDLGPPTNSAWLGGYANANDYISQTIAPIAAGSTGTLSFDLYVDNEDVPGYDSLDVSYGSTNVLHQDLGDYNPVGLYHYKVTEDISTLFDGTAKDLKFGVTTDASLNSAAFIDNVSLNVTAPTPEPASMAVLGMGALALIRRRRK